MGLLGRSQPYDRTRILQAAEQAEAGRRRRKAIALYRRVLAVEPGNHELHARLAPLLAATRQRFDAWQSFRRAGRAFEKQGNDGAALAIYRQAVDMLPGELEACVSLARIEHKLGQPGRARDLLLGGARRLARRRKPEAIHLLRRAREIEPWSFDVVLLLARLLARTRQREEALTLLGTLESRVQGNALRAVIRAQWRIQPSPGRTWALLCSELGSKARSARHVPIRR